MPEVDQVYGELAKLRRGQGLHAPVVINRVGPALREICGIGPDLPPGEARHRLVEQLAAMIKDLPSHLALAVQAAFGLPPASQSRFLRERMQWLGDEIERDPRTATRRVDDGLNLLAERIVGILAEETSGTSVFAPDGWYVNKLRSNLSFHLDPVQLLETRRVTATHEGLDQITASWSVPWVDIPGQRPELRVEVIFGGDLIQDESLPTPSYWSGWIRLPRPLRRGEQHEYQVQVISLARRELRPYYVLSPHRRCDEFELRVKFDGAKLPKRIWRLDGIPYRLVDERVPMGDLLTPDSVCEVACRFQNLRLGLSYGIQWDAPEE